MRKMFSAGVEGQLGDVNVKPLSVPASIGPTCQSNGVHANERHRHRPIIVAAIALTLMATLSTHWPSMHRLKLSRPTNQSGEGTIRDASDTCCRTHASVASDTCR